jgi:hypothetical protein
MMLREIEEGKEMLRKESSPHHIYRNLIHSGEYRALPCENCLLLILKGPSCLIGQKLVDAATASRDR